MRKIEPALLAQLSTIVQQQALFELLFSEELLDVFAIAQDLTRKCQFAQIGSHFLLAALVTQTSTVTERIVKASRTSSERILKISLAFLGTGNYVDGSIVLSSGSRRVVESACHEACDRDKSCVGIEHLWMGLLEAKIGASGGTVGAVFERAKFRRHDARKCLLVILDEDAGGE